MIGSIFGSVLVITGSAICSISLAFNFKCRHRLFLFRKRSLPFLTVDPLKFPRPHVSERIWIQSSTQDSSGNIGYRTCVVVKRKDR